MAKEPIGKRRQPPRDPVALRKKLPALLATPKSTKPKTHPARIQAEQSPSAGASAEGAPTLVQSTEVNDLTAYATCPLDDGLFPNAASATVELAGRFPRGPDYTALDEVIRGLVEQSKRYRRQWRERHEKEDNDLPAPLIVASPETVELYLNCGLRLRDQYIRTMAPGMSPDDMDPISFVDWLSALRPFLDDSTWRFYRIGAEHAIQTIPSADIEEALAWLYSDLHTGGDRRARGDDQQCVNRMDRAHFEKLKFELGMLSSDTARRLEVWLDAGIHTGVHPAQWPLSSLETQPDAEAPHGKRIWLHVVTGHVQARWLTHRTIDISTFSESTLDAIEQMIENAREWAREGQFSARQGEVVRLLRETSKRLFRRQQLRYDLHSPRYQFIDNMRSVYTDAEVAALVGQLYLNKKRKNYVNHRPEWTKIDQKPVPSARLVGRMKKRLEIYNQLKELRQLKDEFRRLQGGGEEDPPAE